MADPVHLLQRLSALAGAGRPVPVDLNRDVLAWLAAAAPAILAGTPPAEALGLAGRRGVASIATRERLAARDRLLLQLWDATDPSLPQTRRAAEAAGRAREIGTPWPVPADVRSVIRICTANQAFPVMDARGRPAQPASIEVNE